MRITVLTGSFAASVFALAATGSAVVAQQPTPSTAPPPPTASTTAPTTGAHSGVPAGAPGAGPTNATAPRVHAQNPLTQEDVSKIKGTSVYGKDGKSLGSVDTVLMKPDSRTVDQLVVKSGGLLGVGGHDVALPLDQFSWDADKDGFTIAKSQDELKSMPEWKAPSSTASATGTGSAATGTAGSSTPPK